MRFFFGLVFQWELMKNGQGFQFSWPKIASASRLVGGSISSVAACQILVRKLESGNWAKSFQVVDKSERDKRMQLHGNTKTEEN